MDVLIRNHLPSQPDASFRIWQYSEKPATYANFVQYIRTKDTVEKILENVTQTVTKMVIDKNIEPAAKKIVGKPKPTTKTSNVKPKPYEIIMQLSDCQDTDYIKNALNSFISKKEFQTVFGIKKTSEIMTGITANKWNKSLVLFLSFLFNTTFVYQNKDVAFNKEKVNDAEKIIIQVYIQDRL